MLRHWKWLPLGVGRSLGSLFCEIADSLSPLVKNIADVARPKHDAQTETRPTSRLARVVTQAQALRIALSLSMLGFAVV